MVGQVGVPLERWAVAGKASAGAPVERHIEPHPLQSLEVGQQGHHGGQSGQMAPQCRAHVELPAAIWAPDAPGVRRVGIVHGLEGSHAQP
eukprot:7268134-Lingulodinium_polyedra.AAC.1